MATDDIKAFASLLIMIVVGLVLGTVLGVAIADAPMSSSDYHDLCVTAGYHGATQVNGDWVCTEPIYGMNGVLRKVEHGEQPGK